MPIARATEPLGPFDLNRWLRSLERWAILGATLLIVAVPLVHMVGRFTIGWGLVGAGAMTQNLALWIGWLGAVAAAFRGQHVGLGDVLGHVAPGSAGARAAFVNLVSGAVVSWLFLSAVEFVRHEVSSGAMVGQFLPVWLVQLALPLGLLGIVASFLRRPGIGRLAALAGVPLGLLAGSVLDGAGMGVALTCVAVLVLAFASGAPIYVVIGGSALVLFSATGVPTAAVAVEAYRIASSPIIPAIPLFTLVGFVMSATGASDRLVEVFRALFGWIPGGVAFGTVLVCAFFSSFTGSSGVLILALGGLLVPLMMRAGYSERFSIGLVTSAGSTGLLLPPSLALILIAVVSRISILDLFVASLLPAGIMILGLAIFAAWHGLRRGIGRERLDVRRVRRALWRARWELATPLVALGSIFGGFATLLEAAALTAAYTVVVSVFVHREIDVRRRLVRIVLKSAAMVGSVFVILSMAMALTSFMIDAQVPTLAADWAGQTFRSTVLFLLAVNVLLIVAGCLMDVFSAVAVLTPLLLPVCQRFGIDPVHLAIVMLANLELGYLTPPIGMNLYFAANRFGKPIGEIIASTLPFLGVMLIFVLLVTYLPLFVGIPRL